MFKDWLRHYSEYKNEFHAGLSLNAAAALGGGDIQASKPPTWTRERKRTQASSLLPSRAHSSSVRVYLHQVISKNTLTKFHMMKNK